MSSPIAVPAAVIEAGATSACKKTRKDTIIILMNKSLKKFGLAYNSQIDEAPGLSEEIAKFLSSQGAEVTGIGTIYDKPLLEGISANSFDALIVLGGDGTMLRASHLCAPAGIPILGVNLGSFGFLMELKNQDWKTHLPRLLSGDYRIECHLLLQAEHIRDEQSLESWLVVNDVVVCRGQYVRPIRLEAEVDGAHMASYVADGIIAATPTGSTAYALAAGGAILPPELRNIIIVPVAPHLSPDQPIILSEGAHVTFRVHAGHQAVVSVDGHDPVIMEDGDSVGISSSELNSLFIRFRGPGYFYSNLNRFLEQNPSLPNNHR
jgi:NAD+ kinase